MGPKSHQKIRHRLGSCGAHAFQSAKPPGRNRGTSGMNWQRRAYTDNVNAHAAPTTCIRQGRTIGAATQTNSMVKRSAEWQGVRHLPWGLWPRSLLSKACSPREITVPRILGSRGHPPCKGTWISWVLPSRGNLHHLGNPVPSGTRSLREPGPRGNQIPERTQFPRDPRHVGNCCPKGPSACRDHPLGGTAAQPKTKNLEPSKT